MKNIEKQGCGGIIGTSSQMKSLYSTIKKVASTESTIVIHGESGTGKELVAKTIHSLSSRADKLFVPLNCGAIPKDLIESELFGHERGAFTGAINTRIGRFELANGGTLLLDEIGELHPSLQVKLLRVLQEREFERVGSAKTINVDVRVISATNKNLEKATKDGTFREDLYYRLNVIPINIPPLRERKDDIPLLIDYFMRICVEEKGLAPVKILSEAMELIASYNWPGNVRELENFVERLIILSESDEIGRDSLPERFRGVSTGERRSQNRIQLPQEGIDINATLDTIEKDLLIQALERAGGVKNKAAAILGLNRTTFLEKLKKKGIEIKNIVSVT